MSATVEPSAKPRRTPLTKLVLVAALFVGLLGAIRLFTVVFLDTVSWQPSVGIGGHPFDPATAQTDTVINVEVWWPGDIDADDNSWLTPEISYTPQSVTITLRTSLAYAIRRSAAEAAGADPAGHYLSPLSFPVQLSEPLGDRSLFDGSTSPATERFRP